MTSVDNESITSGFGLLFDELSGHQVAAFTPVIPPGPVFPCNEAFT
jgi:hypothetical protein